MLRNRHRRLLQLRLRVQLLRQDLPQQSVGAQPRARLNGTRHGQPPTLLVVRVPLLRPGPTHLLGRSL